MDRCANTTGILFYNDRITSFAAFWRFSLHSPDANQTNTIQTSFIFTSSFVRPLKVHKLSSLEKFTRRSSYYIMLLFVNLTIYTTSVVDKVQKPRLIIKILPSLPTCGVSIQWDAADHCSN